MTSINFNYTNDKRFNYCLLFVLKSAGGYVNHPNDPGGETNVGVTKRVYDEWLKKKSMTSKSIKDITQDEICQIYYDLYWKPAHCHETPMPIDLIMFDGSVNSGIGGQMKVLQKAIGVTADGGWGPKTKQALFDSIDKQNEKVDSKNFNINAYLDSSNSLESSEKDKFPLEKSVNFTLRLIQQRRIFYDNLIEQKPNLSVFRKGWFNRMDEIEKIILNPVPLNTLIDSVRNYFAKMPNSKNTVKWNFDLFKN